MAKLTLFQWTGWAPREVTKGRSEQVSCAAVFRSKAEFMRVTNRARSEMPWVSVDDRVFEGREYGNEGARLASATPGVVYWQDTVRRSPREDVWLAHPTPGSS